MELKILKGQIAVLRWLFIAVTPLLSLIIMAIIGWAYGQATEVSGLKKDVEFQKQIHIERTKEVNRRLVKTEKLSRDVQANTIHLHNIKEIVKEIRDLVRKKDGIN
jgi:uncharacterized membrane protein YraQ (UPF0718 family)